MLSIRWTRILTMEPAKFSSKPMAFESTLDTKSTEMKNLLVLYVSPLWCMDPWDSVPNSNPKTNPSIHHNVRWGKMKYLLAEP